MTTASNSTPGRVRLGGDFAPSSTGEVPQLRATGVTPGVYSPGSIVVDTKGRVIFAKQITWEQLQNFYADASYSVKGLTKTGSNIVNTEGTISVPTATPNIAGSILIGDNFAVNSGVLSVSVTPATTTNYGVVRWGPGTWVNASGNLQQWWWKPAAQSVGGTVNLGLASVNTNPDSGLDIGDGTLTARVSNAVHHGLVRVKTDGVWQLYLPEPGDVNLHGMNFGLTGIYFPGQLDFDYFSISNDGVLSLDLTSFSIPTASASVLGGVRVGDGLFIDSQGVLSNEDAKPATTISLGTVRLGEDGGFAMSGQNLTTAPATTATRGVVRIGSFGVFNSEAVGGDTAQPYVGLRFWRGNNTNHGVIRGSINNGGDIDIQNGNMFVGPNVPKKNEATTYTKSLVTSLVSVNSESSVTLDFSDSNTFQLTINQASATIANPSNVVAGQVVQITVRKTNTSNVFTLGANFKLNETLKTAFTNSQALVLSCICVSPTEILAIQSDIINL